MWGIRLDYAFSDEWEKHENAQNGNDEANFYTHFESFMDDSAFKSEIKHKDGIFCLYDGRDGQWIFIGRVLSKAADGEFLGENKPIPIADLTPLEQELIKTSVERNFGVTGDFKHWIVTQYR